MLKLLTREPDLAELADDDLRDLVRRALAELDKRDGTAAVAALRTHLTAASTDGDVRALIEEHGGAAPARLVLHTGLWDGWWFVDGADVYWPDDSTAYVDLDPVHDEINGLSVIYRPQGLGPDSELTVDLTAGTLDFVLRALPH